MVNFQLGKLNVKDEIINNDTSVGQRKNLSPRDPDRNRTHDLPNTGRALYPLSLVLGYLTDKPTDRQILITFVTIGVDCNPRHDL